MIVEDRTYHPLNSVSIVYKQSFVEQSLPTMNMTQSADGEYDGNGVVGNFEGANVAYGAVEGIKVGVKVGVSLGACDGISLVGAHVGIEEG